MILNNEIASLQSELEKIEQKNLRYFSHIGIYFFLSINKQIIHQKMLQLRCRKLLE